RLVAQKTVENLMKRHFDAYYAETKEDALKKAVELIDKEKTVSWGGSVSVADIGLIEYLKENNYLLLNRDAAKTSDEKMQISKQALTCGTYLMGTNAMSEDGELVNVDCIGNRVSALMFGPDNVVVVVGVNKIMPDLDEAISRARNYAAPVNMQKIASKSERQTPCVKTGKCFNCLSKDSICSNVVITRLCYPEGRIKLILCNEEMGF
ncbi:lactate utilization protein, partial [bacterium]|nr:lactate utilization protein [bacterium]